MSAFIEYISGFGSLDERAIELISSKEKVLELDKDAYFVEAGHVLPYVGFILDGIIRVVYFSNTGAEITKVFLEEQHMIYDLYRTPSSEYIQAATPCKLVVFTLKDWEEITIALPDWERIIRKVMLNALTRKLERISPLVSQDAATRYSEFIAKYKNLANRIPLVYIASYLGITPQSLSRIRRNIR